MKEERIYKPYHQYISEAEKLDDDTFFALIQEIEKICCKRINMQEKIGKHNNKWQKYGATIDNAEEMPNIISNPRRLDALVKLCSLVNKVTKREKNFQKSEVNKDTPKTQDHKVDLEKMKEKIEKLKEVKFTDDEKRKIQEWILTEKEEKYLKIIEGLRSKSIEERKRFAKEFVKLNDNDLVEYKKFKDLFEESKYFYKLKQEILTAIIYELRTHPDEYKDYQYGFIKDMDEKDNVSCAFVINVPGNLTTYQFHILRKEEEDILYDINDKCDVKHKFASIVTVKDKKESGLDWIYTSEDIKDIRKIEDGYLTLKKELEKLDDIKKEPKKCREFYLLAILLKKDPEQELKEINEGKSKIHINLSKRFTLGEGKKSIRLVKQHNEIIDNINLNGKIYVSSKSSIDSKVAIEAIIRQARLEGIEGNIEVIEVEPGKKEFVDGIYINVEKKGIDFNENDKTGRIFISANDSNREQSVCSVLSKLGFDVPKNIVKYASKVMPEIYKDPNNAYLLLGKMDGKTIFDFCKEIEDRGEDLIEISLTEEKIESYSSFSDENKKALITDSKKKTKIFEEIKANIEYQHIGDKKVAIYNGGLSRATYAMHISFAEGADYYISCNENEERGIQCCAMSNPGKCDLPLEVERWAYKKALEEGILEDVLIEKTRVIIGGRTKPNIFLTDKRDDKSKKYAEEIKEQIISEIQKAEGINLAKQIVKKSLENETSLQGIENTERDMINTQEKKEKDGGELDIE